MARTGRPREFDEETVVDAAKELFWTRGYEATSVQDLVDGLNVGRASLYAAFGDKHGLFLRALARYVADTRAVTEGLDAEGPVLPRIRAVLLAALHPDRARGARGCLLGNTAVERGGSDSASAESVRAGFAVLEDGFRRALERGRATGELPAGVDPAVQARRLVVVLQGLQVVVRAEPEPARLTDAVDAALAGLRP